MYVENLLIGMLHLLLVKVKLVSMQRIAIGTTSIAKLPVYSSWGFP